VVAGETGTLVTRVSVVHYIGATAKSRSVVASLVADLRDDNLEVDIVDLSSRNVISQDFPPSGVVKLFGHAVHHNAFENTIATLGAAIVEPPWPTAPTDDIREADRADLDTAVESELLTYFRVDTLPHTREVRALRDQLRRAMLDTYWALDALWKQVPPDDVVIPNGRTSRQKAARKIAEHYGIPVTLYENGRARPNSYYRGATQPHDRLASQAEVDSVVGHLKSADIEALGHEWLSSRMSPSGGINSFSGRWDSLKSSPTGSSPTAVFFASSFDEFLAFGPMWTIDSWSHQFEAFDLMMSILERRGVGLVLRLHPNLGSKSRRYFLREVADVRALMAKHPTLKVHWHNSSVNSYDLVRGADYVIVERSTIGLEASMMGKPVWVTQASQWDLTADIRQMLHPRDITDAALTPWSVNPGQALKFAAYWMLQERPLRYSWDSWSTWNPDAAPLIMKAAVLAGSNSWRHKRHLLALEWARWLNGTFRSP
jgi:hypothetical protein